MKPLYVYPDKNNSNIIRLEHYKANDCQCQIYFDNYRITQIDDSYVWVFKGVDTISYFKAPKNDPEWQPQEDKLFYLVLDSTTKKGFDFNTKTEVDKEPSTIEKGLIKLIENNTIPKEPKQKGHFTFTNHNIIKGLGEGTLGLGEFNSDREYRNQIIYAVLVSEGTSQNTITQGEIDSIIAIVKGNSNSDFSKGYSGKTRSATAKLDEIVAYMNRCFISLNAVTVADLETDKLYSRVDLTDSEKEDIIKTLTLVKELL